MPEEGDIGDEAEDDTSDAPDGLLGML